MTPMLALATFPSAEKAAEIARVLVEERLAACVNIIPAVRSIYLWDGKVCDDSEVLGIIKTTRERFDELGARYVELHPYDVPELIALPIVAGNAPYLDWLIESVS